MNNTHLIESKPLDGRYDNINCCRIGHGDPEGLPVIEPNKYGPGFPGGYFPSGHQEIYSRVDDEDGWFQETLPIPLTKAEALLKLRERNCDLETMQYRITAITNS
jgi:hypothetical protein